MRFPLVIAALASLSFSAYADDRVKFEVKTDFSGYPCFLKTNSAREKFTIQLSDYEDVWSLKFWISKNPEAIKELYPSSGFINFDRIRSEIVAIWINEKYFIIQEAFVWSDAMNAEELDKIDENDSAMFSIEERHNFLKLLAELPSDMIQFGNWYTVKGQEEATAAFQECAYQKMGHNPGDPIETDFLAEYRLIFERVATGWAKNQAQAEGCHGGEPKTTAGSNRRGGRGGANATSYRECNRPAGHCRSKEENDRNSVTN